jgi:hypothetical protein
MEFGQPGLISKAAKSGFTLALAGLLFACQGEDKIANGSVKDGDIEGRYATEVVATVAYQGDVTTLPGGAKLFVFARVPGQRMPLAVESFAPSELPLQVGFSPSDSSIDQLEVVARLSMTGSVTKHAGDPEVIGRTVTIGRGGAENVELLIPAVALNGLESTAKGPSISVEVRKSNLITEIPAGAKVYVIAQSVENKNPMPAAVNSVVAHKFPIVAELSDKHSMLSMHRLSMFDKVRVFARLSMSGLAERQSGDWESSPSVVETKEAGRVQLLLDKLVMLK